MIVPFPPPEGELTTNKVPRDTGTLRAEVGDCRSFTSLDILNLFAKFFDLCLDRQSRLFDHQIG